MTSMILALASTLLIAQQGSSGVTRVAFPRWIYSMRAVGPPDSHLVVVQGFWPPGGGAPKPGTSFFLVDALSERVTPLPGALELTAQNGGRTLDMLMDRREVWRVSLAHPSTKKVVRTRNDIQSICFDGDSAEAWYVTCPSQTRKSKLIHLLKTGIEQGIRLSSGTPLGVLDCLPGRCLVQFDDDVDEEGSQRYHLAWISTVTGKLIGMPSTMDTVAAGDRLEPDFLSEGLLLEFVVPAIEHGSIDGPKLQEYEVKDLAHNKVLGRTTVPYPEGQHAGTGISSSGASKSCVFCVETLETKPTIDKRGITRSNSRFRRRYYGYRLGEGHSVLLYEDSVPDLTDIAGAGWSTVCALTNDGHYLVTAGRSGSEIQILPIKPW